VPQFGRWFSSAIIAGFALLAANAVSAQTFPSRPITMLLSEGGSAADILARLIQPDLEASLKQQVLIENRPAQVLGGNLAAARNDGHTIGVGSGAIWLEKSSYDPLKAFAPITLAAIVPFVLIAHPSVTANSVSDLVAYAKANPGKLNVAVSATVGSSSTFAANLFKAMAGIDFVSVPYRGTAQQQLAVLQNESNLAFVSLGTVKEAIEDKKLKALGLTSAAPSPLMPGLPTVASANLAGFEVELSTGILAPAGAPQAAITRLHEVIIAALSKPQTREKLLGLGTQPVGNTPSEFATKMKAEIDRVEAVSKAQGLR
jgi:tripartite-type tricarboxylate transporter receptor subunit TctC